MSGRNGYGSNDLRRDFYEKLSAFAKMVDFLYSSYELFEQVGFERAEMYRKDYLFFKKLKDSVTLRFNDSVDFQDMKTAFVNCSTPMSMRKMQRP